MPRTHPTDTLAARRPAPWKTRGLGLALLLAAAPLAAGEGGGARALGGRDGAAAEAAEANVEEMLARAVKKAPAKKDAGGLWARMNPFAGDKPRPGKNKKKGPQAEPQLQDSLARKLERKLKGIHQEEYGVTSHAWEPLDLKPEPTLSDEEKAARREKAKKIEARLREDHERVQAAARGEAAGDAAFLAGVAADPMHPFAPEAVAVLAQRRGAESDAGLLQVLAGGAPEAQRLALQALVARRHPKAAQAARERLFANDARLRQTAIMAAGELRDRKAAPDLAKLLAQAQPGMGVYAAAALLRIAPREDARKFLERAVEGGTPDVAAQALTFLGMLGDARAAGLCFVSLTSRSPRVAATAARVLHRLPEATVRPVLSSMPENARALTAARWRVVDYLAAPLPADGQAAPKPSARAAASLRAACQTLLEAGDESDLEKTLTCWQKQPEAGQLPILVAVMTDPRFPLAQRDRALFMVSNFLDKAGDDYAPPPEDRRDAGAWEKWWFRQHRLLAVAPGRALLQRPDGSTETAYLQGTLDFSARVRAIAPGPGGPTALEGAKLEIACGNRRYLILP